MSKYECCFHGSKTQEAFSHLHLLHDLFAKGADFCRNTDGDVFRSTVLAAHSVERTGALLNVATQVGLKK